MEVPIRSKRIQKKLDKVIDLFHDNCHNSNIDIDSYTCPEIRSTDDIIGKSSKEIEYLASEEFLRENLLPNWEQHIGYPESFRFIGVEKLAEKNDSFRDYYQWGKYSLPTEIGTTSNALFSHYPADGLTGWHTNWNANAYQILFTWSETGDGFFSYYDKQKDEVVTIEDKPGWQCRWYYFGRKDEPDHHCWHTCYTRCRRMTLAFKFSNRGLHHEADVMARHLRDELVDEITTP